MKLRALAPGKVNLCLALGERRADGRHELVTLVESLSLADELELSTLREGSTSDEVLCLEVEEPNLVSAALEGLRERGWSGPPVGIEIFKQIPVAGGMGGGSADAAAAIRLAAEVAPVPADLAAELARSLGADVPSQLTPGVALGTRAGDVIEPIAPLDPHAFLVLPQPFGLSTADVYAEADRLRLLRRPDDLAWRRRQLDAALRSGGRLPTAVLVNDLQPAALSLRPQIRDALDAAREAGADHAMVCGSGPTVAGMYMAPDARKRALAGAEALAWQYPAVSVAAPVDAEYGRPRPA